MKTKTLLIFLLLCSGVSYSQNQKGSINWPPQDTIEYNDPNYFTLPVFTMPSCDLVGIEINPEKRTGIKYTDRELWLISNEPMNKKQYDVFAAGFVFKPIKGCKVIHIRIQNNEYTFEEFRKILWP